MTEPRRGGWSVEETPSADQPLFSYCEAEMTDRAREMLHILGRLSTVIHRDRVQLVRHECAATRFELRWLELTGELITLSAKCAAIRNGKAAPEEGGEEKLREMEGRLDVLQDEIRALENNL